MVSEYTAITGQRLEQHQSKQALILLDEYQRSDGGSFQRNRKRLLHPRFLDQL
jgi:hypothetical protein